MNPKTILITSVGSQIGEGILTALGSRRQDLRVLGVNSHARAPSLYLCNRAYLVPEAANTLRFHDRLREIIQLEQPDLIIPGRDDDIVLLASLAASEPLFSGRILAGTVSVSRVLRNKLAIARFAESHGLPFVSTMPTNGPEIDAYAKTFVATHGWPVLIKPEEGHGSQEIWLIDDMDRLKAWCGRPGYVIQPYLDCTERLHHWLRGFRLGIPLHSSAPDVVQDVVQVMIGPHGDLLGTFGMHTNMSSGRSWRVIPNEDRRLLDLGLRFGEALGREGWRGPLNIQTKRIGSQYIPFEVNGRFNGTTSARTALGFDELRLILEAFLGIDIGPLDSGATELVLRRLGDHPLGGHQVAKLEEAGMWDMPGRTGIAG